MRRFLIVLLLLFLFPGRAWAVMSTDLTQQRTETENGYRLDYVDKRGRIVFATDKGYATIVRRIEESHIIEETYFDEHGEPVLVSGYHGKHNVYQGNALIQSTFFDEDHNITRNTSGYAIIKYIRDEKGRTAEEYYFDENDKLVRLSGGQYGMRRDVFDEKDRVTEYTYLDAEGNPTLLTSGYSHVRRTYDEFGRNKVEMYFDLADDPAVLSLGHNGSEYIYDDDGKRIGMRYLDADGKPIVNNQGYARVDYTYDEWNNIVRHMYYDLNGKPVALSRGQYGQAFVYDKKERIDSYYIDANGRLLFLLDHFLGKNPMLNFLVAISLTVLAVTRTRRERLGLLLLFVLFAFYMTLGVRGRGDLQLNLELFWSYKQFFTSNTLRVEIINNILLFIPLGALLYSLWPDARVMLILLGLSGTIEGVQLFFSLGLCELDDLFSNGLGGAVGCFCFAEMSRMRGILLRRFKKTGSEGKN